MRNFPTLLITLSLVFCFSSVATAAADSHSSQDALSQFLLGKDVKALLEMPAYKEGIDVYYNALPGKRTDARGVDFDGLTKWLKAKGVGVEKDEAVTITDVKVDSDKVEIHLGGGGEGRRGSNHANKVNSGYKRAGGSRINFRYQRDVTDADLKPEVFLKFMGRLLDVSEIQATLEEKGMPSQFRSAIDAHTVMEGMSYEMVLLSFGDPESKKLDDSNDGKFGETWYYLKNGHRWVLGFENGKIAKLDAY
jgi:hypothetical protein